MGTRGTIHIIDGKSCLCSIYRQYDTYPTGLGQELKTFLSNATVINGFSGDDVAPEKFNGMGCLAAWLIGQLKNGIGNVYMTTKTDRQEYNYFISESETGFIQLKLTDWQNKVIYKGLLKYFDAKKVEGRE